MPYSTTTLSSVGTSTPVNLNWIGAKPVTATVTLGSSQMTTDFTVQFSQDDIMRTASSAVTWVSVAWSSVSTTVAHYTNSWFDTGVQLSFLNPIAALRLSSSTISASALTLKVTQGETL